MTWWQFSLSCQSSELEHVENLMLEKGALSLSLSDAGDEPIYEPLPGDTPVWCESIVTATFAATIDAEKLHQQLSLSLPTHLANGLRRHQLPDQDWDLAYRQHLRPLQCAPNLWIVPSWLESPDPDATIIRLDPGVAFGTGGHPTTALCLAWLAGHSLTGFNVIDYGCGSGILAVAAALLGAKHIWAIDNDPQALIATRDNASNNNVSESIETLLPEALPMVNTPLLLANILAQPLMDFAERFAQHVCPGGHIVLSGILINQAEKVASSYLPWFEMDTPVIQDEWVRLTGIRRP